MFTYLPKGIKGNSQKKKKKNPTTRTILKGKTQDQVVLGLLSYLWNWMP